MYVQNAPAVAKNGSALLDDCGALGIHLDKVERSGATPLEKHSNYLEFIFHNQIVYN